VIDRELLDVGGKHLVSVDADSYIFALFLMDTIACASEGYLC